MLCCLTTNYSFVERVFSFHAHRQLHLQLRRNTAAHMPALTRHALRVQRTQHLQAGSLLAALRQRFPVGLPRLVTALLQ